MNQMNSGRDTSAGLTLTEMLVALAISSFLIVAVGELLRLSARAYMRVTQSVETLREVRSIERWLAVAREADPDLLEVDQASLLIRRGDGLVLEAAFAEDPETGLALRMSLTRRWGATRRIHPIDLAGSFALEPDQLLSAELGHVDGWRVAAPIMREVPYDCRYDAVAKLCR